MKKSFLIIALLSLALLTSAAGQSFIGFNDIKPERNARIHNNMGLQYVEQRDYIAAIQEFKIAISLNPNTQATAVYYNNLGETYLQIGYPHYAQDCFDRAIKQYPLNFKYYQNLVESYRQRGLVDAKLTQLKNSTKPLDKVELGLLYEAKGDVKKAIIVLDEFVMSEPDLLITDGVKIYLKDLIKIQKQGY